MVFSYEDKNDDATYNIYRFSWIFVILVGVLGLGYFLSVSGFDTSIELIDIVVSNALEIGIILGALSIAALIIGWLQVAITSKLGEELILLVTWLSPFAVIATSLFLYNQEQDVNVLGGAAAGIIFLVLVIYFRKSLRLSARLIEVGAEITTVNPSLFIPQLTAFFATVITTVLLLPALGLVISFTMPIHVYLTIVAVALVMWMYTFVVAAFQSFADASNIAYVDDWYSKSSKPTLSKAAEKVKKQRAPVVRFAFLKAFVSRFKRNRNSGWTPMRLFQLMNFSNWKNIILGNRSLTSTAAKTAEYFGSYTLVVLMTENMKSVVEAYKASAKSVFERFVENVAGSMGLNIVENFRKFFSGLLMLIAGGVYGWTQYSQDFIVAIFFAFLFLVLGFQPLNAMFKPVTNAYRLILYRAHTGKVSSKLDSKTKEIIKAVIK